jgi:peptidoglycan/xylan/chitin deacetylase (PgdA/CDA1 family)
MRDLLVLCYHACSDRWPSSLAVAQGALERQLWSLIMRGYRGATFTGALAAPPSRRTLVVTFDDAYRSVLEFAAPVLRSLGLPGTVFVPTDFPGRAGPMTWAGIEEWLGGPFEDELTPLAWDELGALASVGWEIGSHTRSHPRLTQLGDAELAEELAGSKAALEEALGLPCTSIAYPYGDIDQRVVNATAAAGYLAGGALPTLLDGDHPLSWPRVGVYRRDNWWRFTAKTSQAMRRARATWAWELAVARRDSPGLAGWGAAGVTRAVVEAPLRRGRPRR